MKKSNGNWQIVVAAHQKLRHILFSNGIQFCFYCERQLNPDTATLEHLVRQADGGTDDLQNLSLACKKCNSTRGELNPEQHRLNCQIGISKNTGKRFRKLP